MERKIKRGDMYLGTLDRRYIDAADTALAISIGLIKKGLTLSSITV